MFQILAVVDGNNRSDNHGFGRRKCHGSCRRMSNEDEAGLCFALENVCFLSGCIMLLERATERLLLYFLSQDLALSFAKFET